MIYVILFASDTSMFGAQGYVGVLSTADTRVFWGIVSFLVGHLYLCAPSRYVVRSYCKCGHPTKDHCYEHWELEQGPGS